MPQVGVNLRTVRDGSVLTESSRARSLPGCRRHLMLRAAEQVEIIGSS